jgi:hypothetical protein
MWVILCDDLLEMIGEFVVQKRIHNDILAKDWKPKLITKKHLKEKKVSYGRPYLWEIQHKNPYDLYIDVSSRHHFGYSLSVKWKDKIKRGYKGECDKMVKGNNDLQLCLKNTIPTKEGFKVKLPFIGKKLYVGRGGILGNGYDMSTYNMEWGDSEYSDDEGFDTCEEE